ncbi:SMEK domain-containing protein [Rufibacter aurantiacus]|uniref:SMEK domain-containing protein n=1 Tax=Rufibacter aurantiacus TaxID=2817374 RepID=UPI001B318330|nr:SMEK domain-containing protein [Rufibacter aurantiacus]
MNQIDYLNKIKKYLGWYQQIVKISSANNEYDINIHSENILIPILNLVFESNFKNANNEVKNADSIDLIDITNKTAIQVTSTNKISKVKNTLEKLSKSTNFKDVKTLFIYILTDKQSSYSQESIDKSKDKFKFKAKEHILDASDIYNKIKTQNNFDNIREIANLLERQFSESKINGIFTFKQLEEFRESYKEKCLTNFSRLNFFGLSISKKPREVELYSLFVSPTFSLNTSKIKVNIETHYNKLKSRIYEESIFELKEALKNEIKIKLETDKIESIEAYEILSKNDFFYSTTKGIEFSKLYTIHNNIVLLGNPGAGKSSMIKYSICKILENDTDVFESSEIYKTLPLRIELHKYNQIKTSKNIGIVDYLESLLKEEYQLNISAENLQYILQYFPTLVFFDGLDEIFDIQERISVRNDIENFVKSYQESKVLVTSRFESYEEVNLDGKQFSSLVVNNFNDSQVEKYVNNWYNLEEPNKVIRENEIKNCLQQLKNVDPELKYNPLLLSLILILYRNELEIPTSKLKIYEGCTQTIVDTRDTNEKKLKINLKVGNKVSVFSSLAYWQFSESGKNRVFNYTNSQNHIKQYLLEKNEFSEDNLADSAATEFLEFAKTRSIYLENKFTHKTFLEYFTAYFIFSNYYSKHKNQHIFKNILTNFIGLSSWAVVLELLICKIDDQMIDFEVLDEIIEEQVNKNGIDAILFFLQIIKYLKNVSPRISNFLFENSIQSCFDLTSKSKDNKNDYKEHLFNSLLALYTLEKFKPLIDQSFEKLIKRKSPNLKEENLGIFAYELSIASGETSLIKILKENSLNFDNEYLFILDHYPFLLNENTYLDSLSEFIKKFSLNSTHKIYSSYFKQKIFFGSNKFNWCISFLFKENTSILSRKNKLFLSGITYAILNSSASKVSATLNLDPIELNNLLKNNKDLKLEQFIKKITKTYYPGVSLKDPKSNSYFYEKFYPKFIN